MGFIMNLEMSAFTPTQRRDWLGIHCDIMTSSLARSKQCTLDPPSLPEGLNVLYLLEALVGVTHGLFKLYGPTPPSRPHHAPEPDEGSQPCYPLPSKGPTVTHSTSPFIISSASALP